MRTTRGHFSPGQSIFFRIVILSDRFNLSHFSYAKSKQRACKCQQERFLHERAAVTVFHSMRDRVWSFENGLHIFLFELTDLGEVGDEGQFMPDVAARLLLGVRRSEFGFLEVDSFLQKKNAHFLIHYTTTQPVKFYITFIISNFREEIRNLAS